MLLVCITQTLASPATLTFLWAVGRPPRPYDLLWPAKSRNEPPVKGSVVEDARIPNKIKPSAGSLEDVKRYAQRLVGTIPDSTSNGTEMEISPEIIEDVDREWRRRHSSHHIDEEEGGDDGLSGCREAVEILTRTPKKGGLFPPLPNPKLTSNSASYDVHKDGVKVAVLTFTKSAYRLGETILGVVEINERMSRSRVLQVIYSQVRYKIVFINDTLFNRCPQCWKLKSNCLRRYPHKAIQDNYAGCMPSTTLLLLCQRCERTSRLTSLRMVAPRSRLS